MHNELTAFSLTVRRLPETTWNQIITIQTGDKHLAHCFMEKLHSITIEFTVSFFILSLLLSTEHFSLSLDSIWIEDFFGARGCALTKISACSSTNSYQVRRAKFNLKIKGVSFLSRKRARGWVSIRSIESFRTRCWCLFTSSGVNMCSFSNSNQIK